MATVTKAANAHTADATLTITTGWTNPTNAFATTGDNTYATADLTTSKNQSRGGYFDFPAFTTSDIPAGSTINSVTATVEWGMTAAVTGSTLHLQLYNTTTPLGSEVTQTSAGEAQSTHQVTAGISQADLQSAGTVRAYVFYSKGNTSTGTVGNLDFVTLTVDYTAPVVKTGTATAGTKLTGTSAKFTEKAKSGVATTGTVATGASQKVAAAAPSPGVVGRVHMRGLSQESFRDIAQGRGLVDTGTHPRKRFIRYSAIQTGEQAWFATIGQVQTDATVMAAPMAGTGAAPPINQAISISIAPDAIAGTGSLPAPTVTGSAPAIGRTPATLTFDWDLP